MVVRSPLGPYGGLPVHRSRARGESCCSTFLHAARATRHPDRLSTIPSCYNLGIHNQVVAVLDTPLNQRPVLQQPPATLFMV
jgi:hypothetical protein